MVRLIKKPLWPNHPMFSEPVTTFSPVLIRGLRQSPKSDEPEADDGAAPSSERGVADHGKPYEDTER